MNGSEVQLPGKSDEMKSALENRVIKLIQLSIRTGWDGETHQKRNEATKEPFHGEWREYNIFLKCLQLHQIRPRMSRGTNKIRIHQTSFQNTIQNAMLTPRYALCIRQPVQTYRLWTWTSMHMWRPAAIGEASESQLTPRYHITRTIQTKGI